MLRLANVVRERSQRELDREEFSRIAKESGSSSESSEDDPADLRQGSVEWNQFRQTRLTASAFGQVLGMFGDPEQCKKDIWLEKIGLKQPFQGTAS